MTEIYSKEGFVFKKNEQNNYSLFFHMENNDIILSKIIDFNLFKLIYDLNNLRNLLDFNCSNNKILKIPKINNLI